MKLKILISVVHNYSKNCKNCSEMQNNTKTSSPSSPEDGPIYISDELSEFLGFEKNKETTWAKITFEIKNYITRNNVQRMYEDFDKNGKPVIKEEWIFLMDDALERIYRIPKLTVSNCIQLLYTSNIPTDLVHHINHNIIIDTKIESIPSQPKEDTPALSEMSINQIANMFSTYIDNKPVSVSAELAVLLEYKKGEETTRLEIIKRLYAYIGKNNLTITNTHFKKYLCFRVDTKLSLLFNCPVGTILSMNETVNQYLEKHLSNLDTAAIEETKEDIFAETNEDISDDEASFDYPIHPELPTIPIDNINLCFVGGVSTGKSTILNAIFCEELTQCKIKRTTMVPTVYIENDNNSKHLTSPELIFTTISDKNKEIIEKTESGKKLNKNEYDELVFNVGKLDINIMNGSYVNVYDIPGLNDARTKDVYYSYLDDNFTKFNLVVLLVDIHSGLNTSDEIDIVNFITTHTKYELDKNNKQIYTLVVVNKADDMQLDEEEHADSLKLTGELSEMFEQVEKTITAEFNKHQIIKHLVGIIPLCAIDSYLYRMVQKHGKKFKLSPEQILKIGINENGKKFSTLKPATQEKRVYDILNDGTFIDTMIKLSGFSRLESILHSFLNQNDLGKQIRVDNLLFELSKYTPIQDVVKLTVQLPEIEKNVKQYTKILNVLKPIDSNAYYSKMSELIVNLNTAIKEIVYSMKDDKKESIQYYDKMNTFILQVYFSEFVSQEYPDYIKEHVLSLIHLDFKDKRIPISTLVENFSLLKKINMFTQKDVRDIFSLIITNRWEKETLLFDTAAGLLYKLDVGTFVRLLKECESLEFNMSPFIRFALVNLYASSVKYDLYKKQMLFRKYGEIPMYQYLSTILDGGANVDMRLFIYGLTEADLKSDELKLETYYITYEKKYNPIQFVL